jgi:hypothetical protein
MFVPLLSQATFTSGTSFFSLARGTVLYCCAMHAMEPRFFLSNFFAFRPQSRARAVRAPRCVPSSISISAIFWGDAGCTGSHVRLRFCRKARPQISGFACQLIGIIKKPHRRSAVASQFGRPSDGFRKAIKRKKNITAPFLSSYDK